jgi:hypothetical protein
MNDAAQFRRLPLAALFCFAALGPFAAPSAAQSASSSQSPRQFVGFDRNNYPGDAALPALKRSFQFAGYWLNAPPGEAANSWKGKRQILNGNGFGFLVLYNGRMDAKLKKNAAALGIVDGQAAAAAAGREGFPRGVLIFLDLEEGGRLLPEQAAYVFAWIDAVRAAGARAGVYCSGIEVRDESGTISTAEDIAAREQARNQTRDQARDSTGTEKKSAARLNLWIANDACPPAPGCTLTAPAMEPAIPAQLRAYTSVWQYAQSPRRAQFGASCPNNAAPDGNCYAPGLSNNARAFLDLDVADSPDPSGGR